MNLIIFEEKQVDHKRWLLCKANLLEYLEGLKPDFYDYAIQRRIVKNQYLDKLYATIKGGEPIPIITLTYNGENIEDVHYEGLNLHRTEILDGLQRSFRLWALLTISKNYKGEDYRKYAIKVKEEIPLFFDTGVISARLIKNLISTGEIYRIREVFNNYDVYFAIWAGLTEKEVIQKMLVLNAGQKSVSSTHQFELLFLHIYENIKSNPIGIKFYRERDKEANDIKKGNRNVGEFMFSSIIVALQSLIEGKTLRVSTKKLIDLEFEESNNIDEELIFSEIFNTEFVLFFLEEIYRLDQIISNTPNGKEWFSKDTTLSGIFAGVGSLVDKSDTEKMNDQFQLLFDKLNAQVNHLSFNVEEFTTEYNRLASRSINIGTFIRRAIMNYTVKLIEGENPTWSDAFR